MHWIDNNTTSSLLKVIQGQDKERWSSVWSV